MQKAEQLIIRQHKKLYALNILSFVLNLGTDGAHKFLIETLN